MKPDWITLDKTSGTGGGQIMVTASKNNSTSQRTGQITVSTDGGKSEILTVTQNGVVYQEVLNFMIEGGGTDSIYGYSDPCRKIITSVQITDGVQVLSFIMDAVQTEGPAASQAVFTLEGDQSMIPIGHSNMRLSPDMYSSFNFHFKFQSTTTRRAFIKFKIEYEDGSFYEHIFVDQDPNGGGGNPEGQWKCSTCTYVYNPEEGDPDQGIPPGTSFLDIPQEWTCPVCAGSKSQFFPYP